MKLSLDDRPAGAVGEVKVMANDLSGQLLRELHGVFEALHRKPLPGPALEKVTMPQFRVLLLVARTGPAVTDLARRLRLSAPTVSGIVNRLVQAGLVERLRSTSDRRVVKVTATEQGRQLVAEALAAGDERLRRFLSVIEEAEAEALLSGLRAFRRAIIKVVEEEEDGT